MDRIVAAAVATFALLVLSGCVNMNPPATPTPTATPTACTQEAMICPDGSSVGRVGPNCEFAPCPSPTAPPAQTPTPTPSGTPSLQDLARSCEGSFRDQVYNQYRPTYCSGLPPCAPQSVADVKAMIGIDTRGAPIIGFTYTVGRLCSVTTYSGRANFAPPGCNMFSFVVDNEQTAPVPC